MSRVIPTINTARLTLRAMRPQDFDRFAEIWTVPEVVEHVGGVPWTRSVAWNSFLRNAGHWQITGFGQWAIEDHHSKAVIGQTGFFYGSRDLGEDFDQYPEAGWIMVPQAHGQGLGREAAQAAHEWFDRVVTGPLVARVAPANAPSVRLAEQLGYVPLRDAVSDGRDVILMIRRSPPQKRV